MLWAATITEGTLIATDGSNEVIAIGGSNDVVVVVAIGDGDKVGSGTKRHVCSKKDGISMQFSSEI